VNMPLHKSYALVICPYCYAKLIKRYQYLICRYHKMGFAIGPHSIDFQWSHAKSFDRISDLKPLDEISDCEDTEIGTI